MKIKNGFVVRKVGDMNVAVPLGSNTADFNGMIKLNDTGVFIWEKLCDNTSFEELVRLVAAEYEVDEDTVREDCENFIKQLSQGGFLEGVTITEQLASDGFFVGPSMGISMYPMLKTGKTTIVVSAIGDKQPKKNDVLLYKVGEKYILHRLLAVEGDFYIIRGDNCYVKERVEKDSIIGILTEYHRGNKKIVCDGFRWRSYARAVHFFYPVRFCYHKFKDLIKKVVGKA